MSQVISSHKSDTKSMIALGSNVAHLTKGEARGSIDIVKDAFSAIATDMVTVLAHSSLYRTPCIPDGAGPDYVNAVAMIETRLGAGELLEHLHAVERRFDRERANRWAARTLDLDLLDHGGSVMPGLETWWYWHDLPFEQQKTLFPDEILLPHPRIQDRGFVLVPLAEIAPDWRHPVLGRSAAQLCAALTDAQLSGISRI
ncbi:2-amino-4-hydroxy-6-hydroxymethyldihydropteridine diphosphokinase [Tropicimonas sp. TH_r6]|uniref:2-amino-4-hydroxy-6- hydroxymethyldihydropteridine diphosphokinase n=1 Tax=Tropicimonas sp. TH_r6 TaxID=3082085 RepID=UPI0029531DB8|nr:2-amino-4-hydroxy-6-hydroxymethyldihydropteridine diphosphokinase [Tropicimonas sp. TH_r6]MDV7142427.1 2-amino-4-hydroxy-6-hydroxymethyldihydropteridine diphosphokinase [Tropicimonas sp. TH_r6]